MDNIIDRASIPRMKDAVKVALHNADTLGGVWYVWLEEGWQETSSKSWRVTCRELVGMDRPIVGRTYSTDARARFVYI